MFQDHDESVRNFNTYLQSKFLWWHNAEVIIDNVLTRSIADTQVQINPALSKSQEISLEEIFLFVKAKESEKCFASFIRLVWRCINNYPKARAHFMRM